MATFGAHASEWLAQQPHRDSTAQGVESRLRQHVFPVLASRPIAAVKNSEVRALVAKLPRL
jgi:hypothetical protein